MPFNFVCNERVSFFTFCSITSLLPTQRCKKWLHVHNKPFNVHLLLACLLFFVGQKPFKVTSSFQKKLMGNMFLAITRRTKKILKRYFYQMSCKNEHKLFHEDRNRYNDSNDHFQQQISTGRPKTH